MNFDKLTKAGSYVDLRGNTISLAQLNEEELSLLSRLYVRFQSARDWDEYDNYWIGEVARHYDTRGISRSISRRSALYRIAQDLGGRLAVKFGQARVPDYRDQLEQLIRDNFQSRRKFCESTGLSEDMLSHVLAHRKHLAMEKLVEALQRIGYGIRIIREQDRELSDECDDPCYA